MLIDKTPINFDAAKASPLTYQESIIKANQHAVSSAYVKIGKALETIRDKKLWSERRYDNWADYCQRKWGVDDSYASRLITGALVHDRILPIGNAPENESQARALHEELGDQPELQAPAWQVIQEAVKGNKITASFVRMVAKATSEVAAEAIQTHGHVSLNGESIKIIQAATLERLDENQKRQSQHIADRTGRTKPDAVFECAAGNVANELITAGIDDSEMIRVVVYRVTA